MMRSGVLVLLMVAIALAIRPNHVTLYQRHSAPKGWLHTGRAGQEEHVQFFIALVQRNIDQLEKVLYEVSHPYSPNYGEHWTFDQIQDLIAPPKEIHDQVVSWLLQHGVSQSEILSRRDSLQIDTTVAIVEELFETEMHTFVHSVSSRRRIAHLGPISVPNEIAPAIEMVSALSLFPPHRPNKNEKLGYQNQTPWILSTHLRRVYNIPTTVRATNPKTTQAAVEFEWPGCFSYADIQQFQELVQSPFTNVSRIYPPNEWTDTGCDGESTMDLELMLTIGSGANTMYFTNENWIYEFSQTLMTMPDPPLVTSLSWGWMEAQQCDGLLNSYCDQLGVDSEQYVSRTNIELAKVGTMGLSVLVCTQDEGAPSDNNEDCSLDDTNQPVWPIYPASSPYVTAVGATTLIGDSKKTRAQTEGDWACAIYMCNNGTKEKVAMDSDFDTVFTSGGGFSNYTQRPSYQNTAVKTYFAGKGLRPPKSKFAYNGRGYPDIAAAGSKTLIVMGGQPQWNGGTSASTPVTAGVISLLNDWRLNHNKKPLGFLNYLLYEMGQTYPTAFNDITIGNNTCTGWDDDTCCKYGYSAVPGWDPTTGWGTPNFGEMLKFVSKLK